MSEILRVLGSLVGGIVISVLVAHIATERPFSLSLVDRECENAQQQYYDARNRALVNKDKYPTIKNDEAREERDHANVCAQERMADAAERGYWLLLFSLVAAIGAAVAAWWTVSVMRNTAQRQMRAYVGIFSGAIRLVNLREGGRGIDVTVDLKNEGQTPAYGFTTWIKPPVVAEPNAIPFDEPTPISERSGSSILAPRTMAHIHWTIAVSDEEMTELQAGNMRIFAWGGVDYTDAFGHPRFFIFRCWDNLAPGLQNPGDMIGLSPHGLGYKGN